MAKQQELCYRCLGDNHHGVTCPRSRKKGIKGCGHTHNRLLHQDRSEPDQNCIEQKLAAIQPNVRSGGVDKTQQKVSDTINNHQKLYLVEMSLYLLAQKRSSPRKLNEHSFLKSHNLRNL